jgi:hypothetical protein
MPAAPPRFQRTTIYHGRPAERVLLVVGDLDGCGTPEIVVASRVGADGLYWLKRPDGDGDWQMSLMDDTYSSLEAGGVLHDLTGTGTLDFIGGGDSRTQHVSWWECPPDPTQLWTRHLIHELPAGQCHDQFVGDIDGDGRPELYFWNQRARALFGVPVPDDPRRSPWPGVFVVAEDLLEEGFAPADVDGDGRLELVAGLSWYRIRPGGDVERHVYGEGFASPRVAAADFSGDGDVEIVIAEGDASYRRADSDFGRVAHFRRGADTEALWEAEILHEELLDPHSLAVGDFDGDGRPDLFVGELGDPRGNDSHPPAQRLFLNRDGRLEEHVIDTGLGTHEAKAIELDGVLGIAGKPYRGLGSEAPRSADIDGVQLWMPVTDP